jgi:hypothetical protein
MPWIRCEPNLVVGYNVDRAVCCVVREITQVKCFKDDSLTTESSVSVEEK